MKRLILKYLYFARDKPWQFFLSSLPVQVIYLAVLWAFSWVLSYGLRTIGEVETVNAAIIWIGLIVLSFPLFLVFYVLLFEAMVRLEWRRLDSRLRGNGRVGKPLPTGSSPNGYFGHFPPRQFANLLKSLNTATGTRVINGHFRSDMVIVFR